MNDIERLARVLSRRSAEIAGYEGAELEVQVERYWFGWTDEVRAVLKELREPSNIMLSAGEETFIAAYTGTPTTTPDRVFQAMIDAILEEENG